MKEKILTQSNSAGSAGKRAGNPRHLERRRLQDAMAVKADGLVRIPLTRGKWAVVDEADYYLVKNFKWYAVKQRSTFYARSKTLAEHQTKTLHMHRLILGIDSIVDHKDGDGLNNRRNNLRLCNNSQNQINQKLRKDNPSGAKGVQWLPRLKKYRARIRIYKKEKHLGCFLTLQEAALAYNLAAIKFYGEFAALNQVSPAPSAQS